MHILNLVEEHFLEGLPLAVALVNAVRASLHGSGELHARRNRLFDLGVPHAAITALKARSNRFHHVAAAIITTAEHYATLITCLEDEWRRTKSETLIKTLELLSNPQARVEVAIVSGMINSFSTLIEHSQGHDLNFTVHDRNVLSEFMVTIRTLATGDTLHPDCLPMAARDVIKAHVRADRQKLATHEALKSLHTAAARVHKLDNERVREAMQLHQLVTLAHPDTAKHDVARLAGIDLLTTATAVVSKFLFPDQFRSLVNGRRSGVLLDEMRLSTALREYITEVRTNGPKFVYGEARVYWDERELIWPELVGIMRRCLTVPMSISVVEGAFSGLRFTDTVHRQRLLPTNRDLEQLLAFNGPRDTWALPPLAAPAPGGVDDE